ncbi:MAG: hypothetical protein JWM11_6024, partial [Planctomycetaceae bacterium]|nr:hypothetical protein [Planctomycetaceae bacterium]
MASKKTPPQPPSPEALEEVLRIIRAASAPMLAKPLSQQLAPPFEITEKQLIPILEAYVASGDLHLIAPVKAAGKPRYWDRNLTDLGRDAIFKALEQAKGPLAAKDIAAQSVSTEKFAESDLAPILANLAAGGQLYVYAAPTATGKPRYWDRNLTELGREAVLKAFQDSVGPLSAKDLAAGIDSPAKFKESDLVPILTALAAEGVLFEYPAATATGKPRF